MIRITCELWTGGDHKRKRLLGVMSITNDGTGTRTRGNYRVMLRRGTLGRGKLRCIEVYDFPRKTSSVFQLMRWALNALHKEKNLP